MASYLQQSEIENIMDFLSQFDSEPQGIHVTTPMYLYLRKGDIFETKVITLEQIKQDFVGVKSVFMKNIEDKLLSEGYEIMLTSNTKKTLISLIKGRHDMFLELQKESEFLKRILADSPEYIL